LALPASFQIPLPGLDAGLLALRHRVEVQASAGAASKPLTSPGGDGRLPHQSITDEPTTMTSAHDHGGERMV
jgi:hypothetical protein